MSSTTLCDAFAQFLPPACAGCDGTSAPQRAFCSTCRPAAFRLSPPYCDCCRVPMERFDEVCDGRSLCSRCRRTPPGFDQVWAPWEYEGAVADAIRRVKYAGDFPALRALCRGAQRWFARTLERFPANTPLIPIPAHPKELRKRGFHVPSMALRFLGPGEDGHPVEHRLRKVHATPRQAGLPISARQRNVEDVFYDRRSTGSKRAILVDDVLTTGATASAAARVLMESGFDEISVLVLARAPMVGHY